MVHAIGPLIVPTEADTIIEGLKTRLKGAALRSGNVTVSLRGRPEKFDEYRVILSDNERLFLLDLLDKFR